MKQIPAKYERNIGISKATDFLNNYGLDQFYGLAWKHPGLDNEKVHDTERHAPKCKIK